MERADVEAILDAHNEAGGETFEIRWDADPAPAPASASAQAFELPTLDGETLAFAPGEKPAVVAFWASWCAPCVIEAPHLQAIHAELGEQIQVIGVSIDEPRRHPQLRSLVRRIGLTYPVPLDADGSVYATFNKGGTIPYTVVLDAGGVVTYVSTNFEEGDEDKLRAAVEAAIQSRP